MFLRLKNCLKIEKCFLSGLMIEKSSNNRICSYVVKLFLSLKMLLQPKIIILFQNILIIKNVLIMKNIVSVE